MTFTLKIRCDNEAFSEDAAPEIARILARAAELVSEGRTDGALMDANGNRVGDFALKGGR